MGIIDALVGFVRRNPLTCLVVLMLALLAPQVLGGIIRFVLYFILGLVVLLFIAMILFRVKIMRVAERMNSQMRDAQFEADEQSEEGDVKVYKTRTSEQKKVSKNVGDYVEFEEIDDQKEPKDNA